MRMPVFASPVRGPIEDDTASLEIDLHDSVLHERNPVLPLAANDDDVSAGRRSKMVHPTEQLAASTARLEPFEIAPVILARRKRRHLASRNADFSPGIQARIFRRIDACKLHERALAGHAPIFERDRNPFAAAANAPMLVLEDVLGRIRKGSNFDPAPNPERSRNLPERDDAIAGPLLASRLGNAGRLVAQILVPSQMRKTLQAPCRK